MFDSRQRTFTCHQDNAAAVSGAHRPATPARYASQIQAKRLAVIRAPAGFGKTSLAANWSEWLRQHGSLVAWVAIDPDDDEPARFLFYVMHAMHRAAPAIGADALQLIGETCSPQSAGHRFDADQRHNRC